MGKTHRTLQADGISLTENRAFQSFVAVIRKSRNLGNVSVPKQVYDHLHLERGDVVEVAVRKVTREYAKQEYGRSFFPFTGKCVRCGEEGTFSRFGQGYAFFHAETRHYVGRSLGLEIIKRHEEELLKKRGP